MTVLDVAAAWATSASCSASSMRPSATSCSGVKPIPLRLCTPSRSGRARWDRGLSGTRRSAAPVSTPEAAAPHGGSQLGAGRLRAVGHPHDHRVGAVVGELVGPSGSVIGLDPMPRPVAEQRRREKELDHVAFVQGDLRAGSGACRRWAILVRIHQSMIIEYELAIEAAIAIDSREERLREVVGGGGGGGRDRNQFASAATSPGASRRRAPLRVDRGQRCTMQVKAALSRAPEQAGQENR